MPAILKKEMSETMNTRFDTPQSVQCIDSTSGCYGVVIHYDTLCVKVVKLLGVMTQQERIETRMSVQHVDPIQYEPPSADIGQLSLA